MFRDVYTRNRYGVLFFGLLLSLVLSPVLDPLGFETSVVEALLVPLENPAAVVNGERARFGEPIVLSLRGRGVDSLPSVRIATDERLERVAAAAARENRVEEATCGVAVGMDGRGGAG